MIKRCIFICTVAALCVFAFSAPAREASAQSDDRLAFSRILDENVVLYMDSALSLPWFTLPYGYYVKVINFGTSSVKVEYKSDSPLYPSVTGYIRAADANSCETPHSPYPNSNFTVGQSCLYYKDTNFFYSGTVTENSSLEFYGTVTRQTGEVYVFGYVTAASGDRFIGFVPASALINFVAPRLFVEKKEESSSASEEQSEEKEQTPNALGDNLQMIIIVGISVVAISIVYLLFRPSKNDAADRAEKTDDV